MVEPSWVGALWRKSRRSPDGGPTCVECTVVGELVGVRDSNDPDGPVLVFPKASWRGFVDAIKQGQFDQQPATDKPAYG